MFTPEMRWRKSLLKSSQYEQNGFLLLSWLLFYLFFVVRFGDARFWDDFTSVDMSSRQIRQFMDPCKSTLKKEKQKKMSIEDGRLLIKSAS
jgi:thiosulfate reductase cytochrome b subunit